MMQAGKHGARTAKPVLSVSKTSTATGAMNALPTQQMYLKEVQRCLVAPS